ncbi:glycine cleavage system aminomethyltransferase GcvT [Marinithermus hydrothermalis]|uniref:Aminomethyltransferase n=1 Tax=Marinithermus hydrothermalis (strain DSM 14884 / JCM 11576 / T1) TaxID=869210 RepID=F2NM65_MARHT|nr:glycine cleavage system aminomethyltransferase GcvT [Marinithermus hydrothermalis]AEB11535.1 Aminomethyltransferase [Marinithermus hydrothermalis DSM 14884]
MKHTPLYENHQKLGARMVDFAGWAMPIQYTSINAEHLAVRQGVGVFDVSHMGEFWVRGPEALEFLQYVTLNDAARLKVGRAQYSMLPNANGGVVDDVYLYRTGEREYLMVVNAANIEKDFAHLAAIAPRYKVELEDASADWALLAVQGPQAEALLAGLVDVPLAEKRKNSVFEARLAGRPARLARTGYTGEDGFEVFVRPEDAPAVWEALLEAGAVPCGLGARDTLRLEAGFALYGHELTDETNPRCTPFAWVVKEHKEFLGKPALLAGDCRERLVGLVLERGVPRAGYTVLREGRPVGRVTSGTMSPVLRKGIALAYVEEAFAEEGTELLVEVRGKPYPARVVKPPFVPLGKK